MAEAKNTTADKSAKAKFDFTNLNTLAVVSLASAVTGFGAAAAVITGHVSLAQIKKSQESGRGLAIAGVVAGYTVIGLWVLSTLGFIVLTIWGVRHGMPVGGFDDMRGGMKGGPFQMDLNPNGGTQGQD
ncbi:MAG: DUF4190 domain-containing protein [Actinobacteria bacterium]|uniref:Unannotated protein n=1 Tax=freshwater metagenome TaxID=449393 RepID=A0A6J6C1M8_9ZZZZ|nr:DUF4190 domain-containing protein [Actinomycetota bacterium]